MHPPEITDLQTLRMMKDVSQGMCAPAAAARPIPDRVGPRRAFALAHAGLSHWPTPGFRIGPGRAFAPAQAGLSFRPTPGFRIGR
jgi:hypothetical protein